jgi:DNA-binding IclR family transcriptional regulator
MPRQPASDHPVPADRAASVDRAMRILLAIAEAEGPAALGALAAETGLYKSTILRLAGSLTAAGLAMRQSDGRFLLGPTALSLGVRFQKQAAAADILLPLMRDLAKQSGESAAFYVPVGQARICLYRIESTQALRYTVEVGTQLPLDTGSGGRVLAAFLGGEDAISARVRRMGHYHSDGERDPNVAGVSAPVFRGTGEVVGALTLAGPRQRLTPARVAELVPALKAAAAEATRVFAGSATDPLRRGDPC